MSDAIVVGAGPNGLAAAIELARAGLPVRVVEAAETVGGGTRSAELTLPGVVHDVCSAIHPLGIASPFLRLLPLEAHGLEWVEPPSALAHPFDDGTAGRLAVPPRWIAGNRRQPCVLPPLARRRDRDRPACQVARRAGRATSRPPRCDAARPALARRRPAAAAVPAPARAIPLRAGRVQA